MNLLIIANELRYACGVTNHLLHLAKVLTETGKVRLWILCGGGNGQERFRYINAEIITDKRFLHKGRSIPKYISAVSRLAKLIRRNKIDIVHSHTHYAANIARRAAKITKTPTIQTNHGLLQHKGRLKHFNSDYYIAINEHIYDHLLKNKIASEKNISFIRCGIPVDSAPPVKGSGKLKVLAASTFNYEKGLDIFINAVSRLGIGKQKAEFYIAGTGELEKTLREVDQQLNAGIQFLGSVDDMYALLRKTHIFVYPSRSKSEGFPAVITEAGAMANLVISSDFEGVNTVIIDNEDGILFQRENISELAAKLEKAINEYEGYQQHAEKFYIKVKQWFDINTMRDKHLSLYENCLKR